VAIGSHDLLTAEAASNVNTKIIIPPPSVSMAVVSTHISSPIRGAKSQSDNEPLKRAVGTNVDSTIRSIDSKIYAASQKKPSCLNERNPVGGSADNSERGESAVKPVLEHSMLGAVSKGEIMPIASQCYVLDCTKKSTVNTELQHSVVGPSLEAAVRRYNI
jgi:hypothetical protein